MTAASSGRSSRTSQRTNAARARSSIDSRASRSAAVMSIRPAGVSSTAGHRLCPAQVSDDGVDLLAVPLDELRECARASDSRALRQHVVRDERFIDLGCTDHTRAYKQDSDRTAGAQQCSGDGARVLAGAAARLAQRIRERHGPDELRNLQADRWSTHSPASGLPGPERAKPCRCQRITVSGRTTWSASRHPA